MKLYYKAEVSHTGLNKYKVLKADSKRELDMKVEAVRAQWNEQWEKQLTRQAQQKEKEAKRIAEQKEKEERIKDADQAVKYALKLTEKATETQLALDKLIIDRKKRHELNPNKLKDSTPFTEECPSMLKYVEYKPAPNYYDEKYNPKPSFMTKISKRKMEEFTGTNIATFERDYAVWKQEKEKTDATNDRLRMEYNEKLQEWNTRKAKYLEAQTIKNNEVDEMIRKMKKGDKEAVEKYIEILLGEIEFPFEYSIMVDDEYIEENKGIILEIYLPVIEDIPKLKSVSYVKTRKEYKETNYSEAYIRKKYDDVIYRIVLLCLDTVFYIGGKYGIINNAVINGRIDTIDKATGKQIQPCVLSLSISRDKFMEANIDAVDPRVWFKSAKGTSAASIAGVTPVAPVMHLSQEDKRFVEGYEVVDKLDEGVNLAAIDWKDFENLIRELFEKEFCVNGGDVKITRASRDGGVDAVAYDPDPIKGGKIVIQAKRYTNVVDVSAVRDLYGTVLNEGANKGILVTTSNYGNDAYNFIQGKPLTLLNGANLLSLMEKHGYKARIDLKEAKEILKSSSVQS